MTATTFFGNRARACVGVAGFTPAIANLFTVDRGFEANFEWTNHELYGTDSIGRIDEARSELKVTGKLRGCKFDPAKGAGNIWTNMMLAISGSGATTGVIDLTSNTLQLFDVYIYQTGAAVSTPVSIVIYNAYLEALPIPFPENEFMILDLTFKGRTGAIGVATVPVA